MNFLFLASGLSIDAPAFVDDLLGVGYFEWLTNSIFVALVVVGVVVLAARSATKAMRLVPDSSQNLFEALVEGLYAMLEEIVGRHMIRKSFGLLATLFIFILVSNLFGLLPGVGSVGWGEGGGFWRKDVSLPLLRPATADLNMTLAMALFFMVMWLVWTLQELGFRGFLAHMFGVKGGVKGFMGLVLIPIFFFVGIIEVISTLFRPVSLSLRLFGNVFAGENLLTAMISIGKTLGFPPWAAVLASITIPIPFYFLEILIGIMQALVFMLLCAVYLQLSTTHDEDAH
jgi:F-type H+-transporting ATPase subunit a